MTSTAKEALARYHLAVQAALEEGVPPAKLVHMLACEIREHAYGKPGAWTTRFRRYANNLSTFALTDGLNR